MTAKPKDLVAGDGIRVFIRTKDISGNLTDPSGLTLTVRRERDAPTVYSFGDLEKISTGVYYVDITLERGGRWFFHASSTGDVLAATQTFLDVAMDMTE